MTNWEELTKKVADGRATEEERGELVAALTEELEGQQRAAVEADPYGHPTIKLPNYGSIMKALRPGEIEQIEAAETGEFERRRPIAQAYRQQKTAFVQAGGARADFEEHWRAGGENATIAEMAQAKLERARRGSSVF